MRSTSLASRAATLLVGAMLVTTGCGSTSTPVGEVDRKDFDQCMKVTASGPDREETCTSFATVTAPPPTLPKYQMTPQFADCVAANDVAGELGLAELDCSQFIIVNE